MAQPLTGLLRVSSLPRTLGWVALWANHAVMIGAGAALVLPLADYGILLFGHTALVLCATAGLTLVAAAVGTALSPALRPAEIVVVGLGFLQTACSLAAVPVLYVLASEPVSAVTAYTLITAANGMAMGHGARHVGHPHPPLTFGVGLMAVIAALVWTAGPWFAEWDRVRQGAAIATVHAVGMGLAAWRVPAHGEMGRWLWRALAFGSFSIALLCFIRSGEILDTLELLLYGLLPRN